MNTFWTEQAMDLMKSWTETQRRLWEGWLDVAGMGGRDKTAAGTWFAQWEEASRKALDTWQQLATRALDAQAEWARSESFAALFPKGSEEARALVNSWSEQTITMMKSWADAQKSLWQAWFDVATRAARSEGGGADWLGQWQNMARQSLTAWDDLVKQAMDTQKSWLDTMAGAEGATGKGQPENEPAKGAGSGRKT